VDATTEFRAKNASMTSHQLLNLVPGDGVRELVLCQQRDQNRKRSDQWKDLRY
jgi:hypothetical protein